MSRPNAGLCVWEESDELPSAKIAREIYELYQSTHAIIRLQETAPDQVCLNMLRSFKTRLFQFQQGARIFESDNWFKNTGIYREAIAHLKQLQDWLVHTQEIMADKSLQSHISALHDTVCVHKGYSPDETGKYHDQFLQLEDQWMSRWGAFTEVGLVQFSDSYATKLEQIREVFFTSGRLWAISLHVWGAVSDVLPQTPESDHPQLDLFP